VQKIVPSLWFDMNAEQAAHYYVSVFPNSRILATSRYGDGGPGPAGEVMVIEFELDGVLFTGINGGPQFAFDEAVSFVVRCEDQREVDYYWDTFVGDGGEEGQCGWVRDKFGLWWQVVPEGMEQVMTDPDPERARRAVQAMLAMRKIDVGALRAAADGARSA
jgi:predicted 3-demethylubiquinone-9 3-methyltransferase (glyoxalase superfamily)